MASCAGSVPFYHKIQRMLTKEDPLDVEFIQRAAKRFPDDDQLQSLAASFEKKSRKKR